ncbi:unnamed protein product, partial [Didymodactylos carnosus]
MKCIRYGEVI